MGYQQKSIYIYVYIIGQKITIYKKNTFQNNCFNLRPGSRYINSKIIRGNQKSLLGKKQIFSTATNMAVFSSANFLLNIEYMYYINYSLIDKERYY